MNTTGPPADAPATRPAPRWRADRATASDHARVPVERLVLILVVLASGLSLASWRYHFAVRNYGRFVAEQAIPASGLGGGPAHTLGAEGPELDGKLANLGNPYWPQYHGESVGYAYNPVGSDYLGIWHYTREILHGRNPYRGGEFLYNVRPGDPAVPGRPVVRDPVVPRQFVGGLGYAPTGPLLLLPFYHPNYFASLTIYLGALHAALAGLAAVLVWKSPGYRRPVAALAAILFLTSYPLEFLVDRGNTEGVVFLPMAAAVLAHRRGRYCLSAALVGLAASPKLAPAVVLGVFLVERRWRAFAVGVAAMVGANVLAMLCMHESLPALLGQMAANARAFSNDVNSSMQVVRFNHSVFNALRGLTARAVGAERVGLVVGPLAKAYALLTLGLTGWFLLRLRSLPATNRWLVLLAAMLAFPYISGDYKLIHLYLPLGLLVHGVAARGWATRGEVAAGVLLVGLFAPKSYCFPPDDTGLGFGFAVNAALLLGLIGVGLASPLGTREAPAAVGPVGRRARRAVTAGRL